MSLPTYTPAQWERINADAAKMRTKARIRKFLNMVANHSVLVAMSAVFLMPLYLIVVISLMTYRQASLRALWPNPFIWHNYIEVFHAVPFLHWTLNTLIVSTLTMIGTVVSSVPPAYALSRLRWKGRNTTIS